MYPIKKTLLRLGVLLLVLSMSACVSQRQGQQVDRAAALDTYIQLAMAYIESGNREAARHHLRRAFDLERNSEIGRASCRERRKNAIGPGSSKNRFVA